MKFAGSVTIKAPQEELWNFLITPELVTRCVPNLKSWGKTAEFDRYVAEIIFRWGDSRVLFDSEIIWFNLAAPRQGMMRVNGESGKSEFNATAEMSLEQVLTNMTQLNWHVEAQLIGRIAEFPHTFIKTAALVGINKFFKNVKQTFHR
ncbi:MAG: hypothetical protein KDE51_26015 [Anaerolineales bacterium]|nr:hypothetical protein [Anaerolineales bacterium]